MRTLLILCMFSLQAFSQTEPSYTSEEVEIKSAEGHILSGTLTIPAGKGPFACAVMITGSGPQNRDEELLGHKPFAIIADHLSKRGIAVLRCDDRGTEKSTGDHAAASSFDFANDIETQIAFLQKEKKKKINPKAIGLIGHSEGGLIAAIVGGRRTDLAFIVSLAGPGVSGKAILYKQNYDVMRAEGMNETQASENRDNVMRMLNIVTDFDEKVASEKLNTLLDSLYSQAGIPDFENFKKAQIEGINNPWMRFFLAYDPSADWQKIKCPVLAINGEKDIQVDAKTNLEAIAAALEKGNNYNFKTVIFPGMNHLFQTCTTCTIGEYEVLKESISPAVLEEISDYLVKFVVATK